MESISALSRSIFVRFSIRFFNLIHRELTCASVVHNPSFSPSLVVVLDRLDSVRFGNPVVFRIKEPHEHG